MTPSELIRLLTVKAVLLPVKKGNKYPTFKKWQETTFTDTQQPAYQKKLKSYCNTAVLLGKASEHLCSIDFDNDEALNDFLKLNLALNTTLRTKGKRGAKWFVNERAIKSYEKWSSEFKLPIIVAFFVIDNDKKIIKRNFAVINEHQYRTSTGRQWDKNVTVEFQNDIPEFTKGNLLGFLF